MAITATVLGAIIAFACWLERPTFWRSVMLGVAAALAILSKFSALPFLFASGLALLALRWKKVQNRLSLDTIRGWSAPTVSVIFAASLVIWAVYGFTTGSLVVMKERDIRVIDRFAGDRGVLHNIAHAVVEAPFIPAPQFFRGIGAVAYVNKEGRDAYLLGESSRTGWWYFFPVALFFKSPLPFLILATIGFVILVMQSWRDPASPLLVPGIVAAAILGVCVFSRVNIGLRHILPIYPFLAIVAGFGASSLWKARRFNLLARGAVVGLILWQCASSAYTHPDYLAYFNEMAGRHPERILIDSDLDWGQDVKRLADTLIAYGIREISVSYLGGGALERHGPFTVRKLVPHERASGWVAVSEFQLRVRDGFSWLQAYKPVSLVGRSISLYYIPAVVTAH
jgi:4-amino-4-deoxy-L-arabinose transferase-like glycosyltransferase